MIPKEIEPAMDLVAFDISPKTSHEQLKEFSKQGWVSNNIRSVAKDMVREFFLKLIYTWLHWILYLKKIEEVHTKRI